MAAAKCGILKFNNKMFLASTNNIFDDVQMNPHIFSRRHVGVDLNEDIRMSRIAYEYLIDFISNFQNKFQHFKKILVNCESIEEALQKMMKIGEFNAKIHKFFRKKLPVQGESTIFNRIIFQRDVKKFMEIFPVDLKVSAHMLKNVTVACLKVILLGVLATVRSVVRYEVDDSTGKFIDFSLISQNTSQSQILDLAEDLERQSIKNESLDETRKVREKTSFPPKDSEFVPQVFKREFGNYAGSSGEKLMKKPKMDLADNFESEFSGRITESQEVRELIPPANLSPKIRTLQAFKREFGVDAGSSGAKLMKKPKFEPADNFESKFSGRIAESQEKVPPKNPTDCEIVGEKAAEKPEERKFVNYYQFFLKNKTNGNFDGEKEKGGENISSKSLPATNDDFCEIVAEFPGDKSKQKRKISREKKLVYF